MAPLSLFRKKADKDRERLGMIGGKNSSFVSLPRLSTPTVEANLDEYVEYNVEPESGDARAPAPDTRMLSSLGRCAVQVSTVETLETLETPIPKLDFSRRGSNRSATSMSSAHLVTPTFPREPQWNRESKAPQAEDIKETDESVVPISRQEAESFGPVGHWGSSTSEELDLTQLLSLSGGVKASSASPFGFETMGNKQPSRPSRPRPVFDDEDDFYVPGFQVSVRRG